MTNSMENETQALAQSFEKQFGSLDNALWILVGRSDVAGIRKVVQAGADVNQPSPVNGSTVLMFARNGDVVRALVAAGANVNMTDHVGMTALTYSAVRGNTDSVKALIDAGIDVNKRDRSGRSALGYASNLDIVRALIAARVELNPLDVDSKSAMMRAAADRGEADIVAALIDAAVKGGHTPTIKRAAISKKLVLSM